MLGYCIIGHFVKSIGPHGIDNKQPSNNCLFHLYKSRSESSSVQIFQTGKYVRWVFTPCLSQGDRKI